MRMQKMHDSSTVYTRSCNTNIRAEGKERLERHQRAQVRFLRRYTAGHRAGS